jgi:hypothetical protein
LGAAGAVIAAQSGDAAPARYKARHKGFTLERLEKAAEVKKTPAIRPLDWAV